MNLLADLRERTRSYHEAAERQLGLSDRVWSADNYRALLRRFFGYYAPLERYIEAAANWPAMEFNWPRRGKALLLERDLSSAGDAPDVVAALPRCTDLPSVRDLPQALGCLYVLEGSTLGGQVITRHLTAAPGLAGVTGFAFFSSYGAEVGRMWRTFGEFLTLQSGGDDEAIVQAACATFTTLTQWLRVEEMV